jgi:uncharacterized protein (DUF2147 family)
MRAIGLAALVTLALSTSAWAADATGMWRMDNGKVTVKVSNCGGNLCAKIVGLKKPYYDDGSPKVDRKNPDRSLRTRRVIGISLLNDMKRTGDNTWEGEIYVPDDGRTYSATMRLQGNTFKLRAASPAFYARRKALHGSIDRRSRRRHTPKVSL